MSVGIVEKSCPPPVTLSPRMKLLRDISGTVSLITTVISAISIAVFGENIWIWTIYLISAVTGVINNILFKNKKMTLIFIVFTITNTICILRLTLGS